MGSQHAIEDHPGSRPVLLAADGVADARDRIEAELAQRYDRDYRVVCVSDGVEAVRVLAELADSGGDVALVLASASCAERSELFDATRHMFPHAKRALLVPPGAWTDASMAETIRNSMALGRVDHYVPRPVTWPDEVFHEAVANFLLEWARDQRRVPQTVHIVGEEWSGRAFQMREVFSRCAIPHTFCLADSSEGRAILEKAPAEVQLPIMALPDGRILSNPSDDDIADAAGVPAELESQVFDLAIVGSGPAGLSAAVNAASEGLRVVVVDEGGIGGQARSSSLIRNYLGFARGISGSRLAEQAYEQALVFGASFVFMTRAVELVASGGLLTLGLVNGRRVEARTVILAMGASYRRMEIEPLEELHGAGVFYGGPVSEAPALSGKQAFVLGGGNSAGQAALHLARYAGRVSLVVRGSDLTRSMSQYLIRELDATANVEVLTSTTIVDGGGDGRLERLVLHSGGADREVAADALFVLIGARPATAWLPAQVVRDRFGFVLTGEQLPDDSGWALDRPPVALETGMPGVLAAGDVRHASVKRIAAAVGEGATAVQLAHVVLAADPAAATSRRS